MADGIHADPVKAEFLEHAKEEQAHADGISERIRQLGGEPDLDPSRLLSRSHTEYQEGTSLVDMIREDLVAERIAIESYKEMIAFVGEDGPDDAPPVRVDPRPGGGARGRPRGSPEVVRRGEGPEGMTVGRTGASRPPLAPDQEPRTRRQASRTAMRSSRHSRPGEESPTIQESQPSASSGSASSKVLRSPAYRRALSQP